MKNNKETTTIKGVVIPTEKPKNTLNFWGYIIMGVALASLLWAMFYTGLQYGLSLCF
jgi:hypothetical protein